MNIEKLKKTEGVCFNIQKFCTDDGPGIRTTVFLKGCSLNCRWCHNPEGIDASPILEYRDSLCAFCRRCEAVCPKGCHTFDSSSHIINRTSCVRCGICISACTRDALRFCGKVMTAEEVMELVLADKAFYSSCGGGLTLSGGEPLLQTDFAFSLLVLAKENGINTCVETSGAVHFDAIKYVLPYTDLFLFDVKETDSENHRKYVGISNELPLENLKKLDELGGKVILRCPIIPEVNDNARHFENLKKLYSTLKNTVGIELLPYHSLGVGKLERFGIEARDVFKIPTKEEKESWNDLVHGELR